MSHRVAPCGDFSSEVERVPENSGCGEIRAVSEDCMPREVYPQIAWLAPAIWLQDKGGWL